MYLKIEYYLQDPQVLNNQRQEALKSGRPGPNCILLGPTDSGKSTITRMLCNWAVRSGWEPMMVDLDVGQGTITVPGCIAATPIESPVDIVEGYPLEMPLVFFFGHASPSENPDL
jgi:polyribonucleotide 5'-hydroxyl-kinase